MSNQNYLNKNIDIILFPIREYDMSEAGFSLIKEYELLPASLIKKLETKYTKKERTIKIGKLMNKYEDLSENLMDAFKKARKLFIEENNLNKSDILAIKKDAIFVIRKSCKILNFGKYITFKLKNTYTSYYHIGRYEFYYSSKNDKMDIKGLTVTSPLLNEIQKILKYYENNKSMIYKVLKNLRNKYLNKEFDIEYYRELNSKNMFRLNYEFGRQRIYAEDCIDKSIINIEYNYLNIILPLINIMI